MKKGFTMIELLAVFTLMGIILVLSFPQITALLKKSNDEDFKSFSKTLCIATEAYVVDKKIEIANNSQRNIYVSELVSSGYLKSSIINPKNNKKISQMNMSSLYVTIIKNDDGVYEKCDLNGF